MRFTFRHLEYFIAAGEAGSIRAAADKIAVSQPSISAAVSHLERELGVQLFVRHHAQGLSLTPAGKRLLREARVLLDQAAQLPDIAAEITGQLRGRLALGCFATLAPMILPELVSTFRSAAPEAEIRFFEADQARLIGALRQVEIDVALTYDLELPEDVAFEPLAALPPHVLLSAGHRLADRPLLTLEELADEPLVLLDLPMSREYFLAMYVREGLSPRIAVRTGQMEGVRALVAGGFGYSIANVRPRSREALDGRPLVRVPLAGEHPALTVGLMRAKSLEATRLSAAFADHCRAFVSDSHIPGMEAPALARVRRTGGPGLP